RRREPLNPHTTRCRPGDPGPFSVVIVSPLASWMTTFTCGGGGMRGGVVPLAAAAPVGTGPPVVGVGVGALGALAAAEGAGEAGGDVGDTGDPASVGAGVAGGAMR